MPEASTLSGFLLASLVLAATPGPGVMYIVARTLAQGRRAGLSSVAGVAMGNLVSAMAASIGLAALFALSTLALPFVKYAGALYLVVLGVQTLRSKAVGEPTLWTTASLLPIFRDGFVVALLNPKTALFFAAFLPQFVDPAAPVVIQNLCYGALFAGIAAVTDSLYVLTASAVLPGLTRSHGVRVLARYLSAGVLIGLGVLAALSGVPASG